MPAIPTPRIPSPSDIPPAAAVAEAARLDAVADSLLRFAEDFADRAKPFATRAQEYRSAAQQLRGAR